MIRSGRMRDTCKIPSCCSKIKGSFSNIWKIFEQSRNSGWTDKGYKGHLYLYFQFVQRMYANEHIVTLSSGDLRVSDHPVVCLSVTTGRSLYVTTRRREKWREKEKWRWTHRKVMGKRWDDVGCVACICLSESWNSGPKSRLSRSWNPSPESQMQQHSSNIRPGRTETMGKPALNGTWSSSILSSPSPSPYPPLFLFVSAFIRWRPNGVFRILFFIHFLRW
jgi:hypothetical protein